VQAVIDSTFTLLDLDNLRQLAATDIEVVGAIATHLAERVHYDRLLERFAFSTPSGLPRSCERL
jgi:hypothetical protein